MVEPTKTDYLASELARGQVFDAACRSRDVLTHLTGKWTVLILIALREGTKRFAELRRKLNGVSERMLAKNLKQLEAHRLLIRKSYPVVPPHVEYTLTPLGQEAAERMATLTDWIEENIHTLIERSGPSA